jgi:hypothetical protein
MCNEVIGS